MSKSQQPRAKRLDGHTSLTSSGGSSSRTRRINPEEAWLLEVSWYPGYARIIVMPSVRLKVLLRFPDPTSRYGTRLQSYKPRCLPLEEEGPSSHLCSWLCPAFSVPPFHAEEKISCREWGLPRSRGQMSMQRPWLAD
jgi:hypothetical protein